MAKTWPSPCSAFQSARAGSAGDRRCARARTRAPAGCAAGAALPSRSRSAVPIALRQQPRRPTMALGCTRVICRQQLLRGRAAAQAMQAQVMWVRTYLCGPKQLPAKALRSACGLPGHYKGHKLARGRCWANGKVSAEGQALRGERCGCRAGAGRRQHRRERLQQRRGRRAWCPARRHGRQGGRPGHARARAPLACAAQRSATRACRRALARSVGLLGCCPVVTRSEADPCCP